MRAPRSARLPAALLLATSLAGGAGCKKEEPQKPEAAPAAPTPPPPTTVTLLITADENGALLPHEVQGRTVGGAAQMLGAWVDVEKHCVAGGQHCAPERTLALSTGDHWSPAAISARFAGEPAAEAMGRMNYAASGFGNHELDFGREQFVTLKNKTGTPFIAANLTASGPDTGELKFPGHVVLERDGMKVGVVALSNVEAPERVMAGRFEGLTVQPYEEALSREVPAAWAAGADAVVVLADECPTQLEDMVGRHPEWKLSVVAGGHCHGEAEGSTKKVGNTTLVSPGRRFERYARAALTFDKQKPAGQRLTGTEVKVVEVTGGSGAPAPDAKLAQMVQGYEQKAQEMLGQQIGFSKAGLPAGSPQLQQWVTRALRESLETDVALVNKGGLRGAVPAGKVTMQNVYDVLPFDNTLLVLELTGEQLVKALDNPNAVYGGVTKAGKGYKDARGKAIEPGRTYKVATVEYLYFGGDGFELEKADPEPTETGMVWQTPVVEWTQKQNTNERRPLEVAAR